jgi:teichuronic acid biosynthesis glycosyltransferase TuaC
MKIALVPGAFLPQVGGVELGAYNLARQLQLRGHDVHVITSRPLTGGLGAFELLDGIPVHRLRFYLFRGSWKSLAATLLYMPLACIEYALLVRRGHFNIVNVRFFYHNAFATLVIEPLLRHWRVPVVVTLEGGDAPNISNEYRSAHKAESVLLTWAARRLLPRADRVTAVSAQLGLSGQRRISDLTECVVIHNGVDLERFVPGPKDSSPLMVSVGRMAYQKGIDVLLRAFAEVRLSHPLWRLLILGDGPLKGEMERLAAELGLASSVCFRGTLPPSGVAQELQRASLFVLSSRFEGFPLAVLEAMASGTPIVMTDVEGARELIAHPDRGRIVAIDDVKGLASALSEMIGLGPEKLQAMGTACREWVAATHSWQQIARDYEAVFAEVIARRSPQPHAGGMPGGAARL